MHRRILEDQLLKSILETERSLLFAFNCFALLYYGLGEEQYIVLSKFNTLSVN